VYMVEESPTLRDIQKKLLCGDAPMEETELGYQSTSKHLGVPIIWTEDVRTLPKGELPQLLLPMWTWTWTWYCPWILTPEA
jgi:hypothetical protein